MDSKLMERLEILVQEEGNTVSFKWLSRELSISSNRAKRLLEDYTKINNGIVEALYVVSGWTHSDPPTFGIQLASTKHLDKAKLEFKEVKSTHVYSVARSLPLDSSAIWNVEFSQTEELFKQPKHEENCLRDNRFSGVSSKPSKHSSETIAETERKDMVLETPKSSTHNQIDLGKEDSQEKPPLKSNKRKTTTVLPTSVKEHSASKSDEKKNTVSLIEVKANAERITDSEEGLTSKRPSLSVEGRDETICKSDEEEVKGLDDSLIKAVNPVSSLWKSSLKDSSKDGRDAGGENKLALAEVESKHKEAPNGKPDGSVASNPKITTSSAALSHRRKKKMITTVDARGKEVTQIVWVNEDDEVVPNPESNTEGLIAVELNKTKENTLALGGSGKQVPSKGIAKVAGKLKVPAKKGNIMMFFKREK